jgi:hypothetical protein
MPKPFNLDSSRNDAPIIRKRVLDLRRVKATEQLPCMILSPWVMGYDTHWMSNMTAPCTMKTGDCILHDANAPYKWIGFLHILPSGEKDSCFLELTDFAWKNVLTAIDPRLSLRGLRMCFMRKRQSVKSPVICNLLSPEPMLVGVPPAQDVETSLRVAWKRYFTS